jgi:archaemetzincin
MILPIGTVASGDLHAIAEMLSAVDFEVSVGNAVDLSMEAFDPARDQYRATDLLGQISGRSRRYVLGVIDADLYADGLNFIFGIADPLSGAAIIALPRLRLGADEKRYRTRMVKEAVHEIGHTLGLGHCPDPGCVMHFSNTLEDTDRKGHEFCDRCRGRLRSLG